MINEIENACDTKLPEKINQFIDNYNKNNKTKDANTNNIYHIISEDINGNIVDEHFALNVITNAGMTKYQKSEYKGAMCYKYLYDDNANGGMFFGIGSGTPSVTDTSLFTNSTYTTPTKEYCSSSEYDKYRNIFSMTYDPETDIITQHIKIATYVLDYNLSGITENIPITEIGIGPSITNLYFHALIYDTNGNVSSFTKNINERLTIYVYSTISMKSSIFSNLYNKGVYACFQPYQLHKGNYYNDFGYNTENFLCGTPRLDGWYSQWTYPAYQSFDTFATKLFRDTYTTIPRDNVYQCKLNNTSSKYMLSDKRANINKVALSLDADRNTARHFTGLWIYPNLGENVTEEIVSTQITTNGIWTGMGLDCNFGGVAPYSSTDEIAISCGCLPVSDINITSLKMFNYQTGEYDIPVNIVDNDFHPEARYNLNKCTSNDQYDWDENFAMSDLTFIGGIGYVMVNENTSIPIKSFFCDGDSSVVIKATDSFWNTSSFVQINNKNDVPTDLRNKRYYIFDKSTKVITRYLDRDQKYPTVLPNEPSKLINGFSVVRKNTVIGTNTCQSAFISSDTLEYLSNGLGIFYPETYDGTNVSSIVSYKFTEISDQYEYYECAFMDNTINGDVIVKLSGYKDYSKKYIYLIQVGDSTTTPIVNKITYATSQSYYPFVSLSKETGIVTLQHMVNSTTQSTSAMIIRIYDADNNYAPTITELTNTQCCRVIHGTSKYIYLDLTDGENLRFNIKDALTDTIDDYFLLDPTKYTTVDGILGWKTHIWLCIYSTELLKYVTVYYNTESKNIQILNDLNTYNSFTFHTKNINTQHGLSYIDECMCVVSQYYCRDGNSDKSDKLSLIFTDNNPTNPSPLSTFINTTSDNCYNNNTSSYHGQAYTKIQVKKVNNGKNIVLLKTNVEYGTTYGYSSDKPVLNDIGSIIYNNTPVRDNECRERIDKDYYSRLIYGTTLGENDFACLYKDSVHVIYDDSWRTSPFESWELMKLIGTTKTIQAYNNPKGVGYNFPVTFEVTNNSLTWT